MKKREESFALILTLMTMTMLSVLALSFITYIRVEKKIALNYYYKLLADYAAESGVEKTISLLKAHALNRSYYDTIGNVTNSSSLDDYRKLTFSYTTSTIDCASQIYLNDDSSRLEEILEDIPDIGTARANAIINNQPYKTKQELMRISGLGTSTYDAIKDYLSVYSWVNPYVKNTAGSVDADGRPPININSLIGQTSTDRTVLKAILRPLGFSSSDDTDLNNFVDNFLTAENSVNCSTCSLNSSISNNAATIHVTWCNTAQSSTCPGICGTDGKVGVPYKSFRELEAVIDEATATIPSVATLANVIKDNINPNRTKPANYTTEFSFNATGYFDITATGEVQTSSGTTLAKSSVNAIVHVLDVKHFTLENQFADNSWEEFKVNSLDACPVDSSDDWNSTYTTIDDSVKLGFWDDFSDPFASDDVWNAARGGTDSSTGVLELNFTTSNNCITNLVGGWDGRWCPSGKYQYTYADTIERDRWQWEEFYCHIWLEDVNAPWVSLWTLYGSQGTYSDAPPHTWAGTPIITDPGDWMAYWKPFEDAHNRILGGWPVNVWDVGRIEFGVHPTDAAWILDTDTERGKLRMLYEIHTVETDSDDFYIFPRLEINLPSSDRKVGFDPAPGGSFPKPDYPFLEELDAGSLTIINGKTFKFDVCATRGDSIRMGIKTDNDSGMDFKISTVTNLYNNYQTGLISIFADQTPAKADNIRIIPRTPYYNGADFTYAYLESASIPEDMTDAEAQDLIEAWGTISGTVTLPSSADCDSEFVFFQTNEDAYSGNIVPTQGRIIGSVANPRLKFRALFESNQVLYDAGDPTLSGRDSFASTDYFSFSETPVLEDVTVTYLPSTEIVYWKRED